VESHHKGENWKTSPLVKKKEANTKLAREKQESHHMARVKPTISERKRKEISERSRNTSSGMTLLNSTANI